MAEKETFDFFIEYYPLSRLYFTRCNNDYLRKNNSTGFIETADSIENAKALLSEDEARLFIDLFKEQRLKKDVLIIKI